MPLCPRSEGRFKAEVLITGPLREARCQSCESSQSLPCRLGEVASAVAYAEGAPKGRLGLAPSVFRVGSSCMEAFWGSLQGRWSGQELPG